MGGLGSGRKYSDHERRPIVEDFPCMDLRTFKKHLTPGTTIVQTHMRSNEKIFKIVIDISPDCLVLHYRFKEKIRTIKILIIHQPCNLGGQRSYLLCPECNKKRSLIYMDNSSRWACRECLGLAYRSQRLNPSDRHLHMATKIRDQKLKSREVLKKPYRMKTKKHAELVQKITWHQNKACESFRQWFEDIQNKYD